jgi:hypothetical protein
MKLLRRAIVLLNAVLKERFYQLDLDLFSPVISHQIM